jgi:preprotein translocase subunit SecG
MSLIYLIGGILAILASVLMILAVTIQNSKGGGINPSFSNNATQILGARRSTEAIEKITWVLAGAIGLLALLSNINVSGSGDSTSRLRMKGAIETQILDDPAALPDASQFQQPAGGEGQ